MLDYIIILVASLTEFHEDISKRYGIELTHGGAHQNSNTANLLAQLGGGAYLQVLGPNPGLETPTGLDEVLSRKESPEVLSLQRFQCVHRGAQGACPASKRQMGRRVTSLTRQIFRET